MTGAEARIRIVCENCGAIVSDRPASTSEPSLQSDRDMLEAEPDPLEPAGDFDPERVHDELPANLDIVIRHTETCPRCAETP